MGLRPGLEATAAVVAGGSNAAFKAIESQMFGVRVTATEGQRPGESDPYPRHGYRSLNVADHTALPGLRGAVAVRSRSTYPSGWYSRGIPGRPDANWVEPTLTAPAAQSTSTTGMRTIKGARARAATS